MILNVKNIAHTPICPPFLPQKEWSSPLLFELSAQVGWLTDLPQRSMLTKSSKYIFLSRLLTGSFIIFFLKLTECGFLKTIHGRVIIYYRCLLTGLTENTFDGFTLSSCLLLRVLRSPITILLVFKKNHYRALQHLRLTWDNFQNKGLKLYSSYVMSWGLSFTLYTRPPLSFILLPFVFPKQPGFKLLSLTFHLSLQPTEASSISGSTLPKETPSWPSHQQVSVWGHPGSRPCVLATVNVCCVAAVH